MLTIYTKSHCPDCTKTKNYLTANQIDFQEIDIETDTEARAFLVNAGHRAVPQIYQNHELFVEGGWAGLNKITIDHIKHRLSTS